MQNSSLICNTFLMCGRYRLSRRKQLVEEYFDTASVEHGLESPIHHRPYPKRPYHPPKSEGTCPGNVACSLGTRSILG